MTTARTLRQQIILLLTDTEMTASELSQSLEIKEKEVCDHLSHVYRTVVGQNRKLHVRPSECLKCGFVFKQRNRFTTPGRCPQCKGTHLKKPAFKIDRYR